MAGNERETVRAKAGMRTRAAKRSAWRAGAGAGGGENKGGGRRKTRTQQQEIWVRMGMKVLAKGAKRNIVRTNRAPKQVDRVQERKRGDWRKKISKAFQRRGKK